MEKDREVYWEYANVTCAGYPLQHIDTISHSGEINTNSVMYKVVYGVGSLPMNRRNFILFKPINEENEARCAWLYDFVLMSRIIRFRLRVVAKSDVKTVVEK